MVPGKARKAQSIPSAAAETDGEKGTGNAVPFRVPESSSQTRARGAAAITRDAVCNVPEETVKVERDPVVKERE